MRTTSFFAACGLLVLCFVGLTGCGRSKPGVPAAGAGVRPHGHHHGHGPHGGHVVALDTEEYHAEITQDDASHRVGVYLLDANASATAAVPIETASVTIDVSVDDKPVEYTLPAVAQPDDAAGKSSYFELESEPLLAVLSGAQTSKTPPELKLTIEGKSYVGVIEDEHAHEHATAHGHSHGEDDTLVWRQELSEAGYDIALGHHGVTLLAGSKVEPAVQVTRGGEPVAEAQVFNTLLDAEGQAVLAEEVAAVYEPPTEDEPAHYAQGGLMIPPGTREAKIRFRVVFPEGGGERTFDVPVTVQ